MKKFISIVVLMLLAGLPWAARAMGLNDLTQGARAQVARVVDGDTVVLDDGRQVRLVGIQAPKLPLGRSGFTPWPLSAEAKTALERLALNQTVELRLPTTAQDRHGRVLAHLVRVSDGAWLQGEMLAAGLARVYTFPDNRLMADEMLGRERQARADGLGIWGLAHYAVRTPDNVRHDDQGFYVVQGRVVDAVRIKDRVYLNFGPDWRTDFTVKIRARHEKAFTAQGLNLIGLKGRLVRVRGWLKSENGPMIELDHPERLEVIGR